MLTPGIGQSPVLKWFEHLPLEDMDRRRMMHLPFEPLSSNDVASIPGGIKLEMGIPRLFGGTFSTMAAYRIAFQTPHQPLIRDLAQ